jgi:hypothetical protein
MVEISTFHHSQSNRIDRGQLDYHKAMVLLLDHTTPCGDCLFMMAFLYFPFFVNQSSEEAVFS